MHQAEAGPAHQNRAYEFVGCPMKAAADKSDIDPANMVSAAGLVCGAELFVEFMIVSQYDTTRAAIWRKFWSCDLCAGRIEWHTVEKSSWFCSWEV